MRSLYTRQKRTKLVLIILAAIIITASMYFSNQMVKEFKQEEQNKVELWVEAYKQIATIEESSPFLEILRKVMVNNTTIPLIVVDENDEVINDRNLHIPNKNREKFLQQKLEEFKTANPAIEINTATIPNENTTHVIYYGTSILLKQLAYYPYVQLGVIGLFFFITYFAFKNTKKLEENQVWVGLTKETAHQLGTPISSLMAWMELLKTQNIDPSLLSDMSKDVDRLRTIAERFSKIGSKPDLEMVNLTDTLTDAVEYIKKRASSKVTIASSFNQDDFLPVYINISLFAWVVENICKNAIDAMNGKGNLNISIHKKGHYVNIDIKDTGKGIPKSHFKTIFNAGYTTKKRGWGLGLSLAKRIIENYHQGRIHVKDSELNQGSTFRITLPVQPM